MKIVSLKSIGSMGWQVINEGKVIKTGNCRAQLISWATAHGYTVF
jgi:hypothetical protein